MGYRRNGKRSNGPRRSKLHTVRQRRRTSKNHSCLSSCVHRCVGGEALKKVQMMKALDFGIQSGYLVPTDKTYKILRLSSNLLKGEKSRSNKNGTRNCRRIESKENSWNLRERDENEVEGINETSQKFDEHPVEDARRRRSRSRRRRGCKVSRSRSRSRSRSKSRRSHRRRRKSGKSSDNPEELGEDEDDYEQGENTKKKVSRNEHTTNGNDSKNSRSKSQEIDKTNAERSPDNISDVSLDDDDDNNDDDDDDDDNDDVVSEEDEEDKKETNAS